MGTFAIIKNEASKKRLTAYASRHRLGVLEFVEILPSVDELQSGDVLLVESLGDVFSSADEALKQLDLMKLDFIALHVVDLESVESNGNVTWGVLSDVVPSLIKQLSQWRVGETSKRIKAVKAKERDKSVYRGGRKEKGFTVRKEGRKQVQVVDELERNLLIKLLEFKKMRENDISENNGRAKTWSLEYTHRRLDAYYDELSKGKHGDLVSTAEGKKWRLEWKKQISDSTGKKRNVRKFGLATIHRLLDDNYHNNLEARLARMKQIN